MFLVFLTTGAQRPPTLRQPQTHCDSRQHSAAGSRPVGWATCGSRAVLLGGSGGTGSRCPPAAPATGCCMTPQRSRRQCHPLLAGRLHCYRLAESPSAAADLKRHSGGSCSLIGCSARVFLLILTSCYSFMQWKRVDDDVVLFDSTRGAVSRTLDLTSCKWSLLVSER